jgi:acyl-CoA thioester hydrolase
VHTKSILSASVILDIPFHDIDSMGVVWHGHYVKYLEIARTALMRQVDLDVPQMMATGYLWPVVDCRLKYIHPIRYGQIVRVEAHLLEYENRLKISYLLTDAGTGERLTRATTIQVAILAVTGEMLFENPRGLVQSIERVLEEGSAR